VRGVVLVGLEVIERVPRRRGVTRHAERAVGGNSQPGVA
jgi:hypothetical protein